MNAQLKEHWKETKDLTLLQAHLVKPSLVYSYSKVIRSMLLNANLQNFFFHLALIFIKQTQNVFQVPNLLHKITIQARMIVSPNIKYLLVHNAATQNLQMSTCHLIYKL